MNGPGSDRAPDGRAGPLRVAPSRARRLRRDDRGSLAIEFALVALPFFALLFAILETAIVFAAGEVLQTSVSDASRTIMTGEAKDFDKAAFKAKVCDRLAAVFACEAKLALDVRTLKAFKGAGRANPYVNGKYDTSKWGYDSGGSGAIVVVTAAYPWPVVMNIMGFSLADGDAGSGSRLLLASAVVKNERFAGR